MSSDPRFKTQPVEKTLKRVEPSWTSPERPVVRKVTKPPKPVERDFYVPLVDDGLKISRSGLRMKDKLSDLERMREETDLRLQKAFDRMFNASKRQEMIKKAVKQKASEKPSRNLIQRNIQAVKSSAERKDPVIQSNPAASKQRVVLTTQSVKRSASKSDVPREKLVKAGAVKEKPVQADIAKEKIVKTDVPREKTLETSKKDIQREKTPEKTRSKTPVDENTNPNQQSPIHDAFIKESSIKQQTAPRPHLSETTPIKPSTMQPSMQSQGQIEQKETHVIEFRPKESPIKESISKLALSKLPAQRIPLESLDRQLLQSQIQQQMQALDMSDIVAEMVKVFTQQLDPLVASAKRELQTKNDERIEEEIVIESKQEPLQRIDKPPPRELVLPLETIEAIEANRTLRLKHAQFYLGEDLELNGPWKALDM
ncbi:hypothetical protein EDD86DRAFT_243978 [Gorgonomyces haynaldii]|nr:hypothetical protein EDD86DRAFT_243978 [Gorgonomyces haynaldii]